MGPKSYQRGRGWVGRLAVVAMLGWSLARAASAGDCDATPFARMMRGESCKPRLVVVISVDQFRADYLTRYADLFAPAEARGRVGGFKYLMTRGAWFVDAR